MQTAVFILEWAAAAAALIFLRSFWRDKFVRALAMVAILVALCETAGRIVTFYSGDGHNAGFYNYVVEPVLFASNAYAFYCGLHKTAYKRYTAIGLVVVLIIYFVTMQWVDTSRVLNVIGFNTGSLFIASLAMFKTTEIIATSADTNYFRNPVMLLCILTFLYYLIGIPLYSVGYYFYVKKLDFKSIAFLLDVENISNCIFSSWLVITFAKWAKKGSSYSY